MLNAGLTIGLLVLLAAPATRSQASGSGQNTAAPAVRYVPPPPPRPEAPVPDTVPAYSDLKPALREEMPDLDLTMIRYHADPEQRFVILNGIRANEGLPAGRDLWIHEIRPTAVVMKYIDQYFLLRPR